MSTIPENKMPAPRLELRWRENTGDPEWSVACDYNLVIALGEYDIRGERDDAPNATEQSVRLGCTRSTGALARRYSPERDEIDTPFRDGVHAKWDSAQLGWLPIYAVALGRAMLLQAAPAEPARTKRKGEG